MQDAMKIGCMTIRKFYVVEDYNSEKLLKKNQRKIVFSGLCGCQFKRL